MMLDSSLKVVPLVMSVWWVWFSFFTSSREIFWVWECGISFWTYFLFALFEERKGKNVKGSVCCRWRNEWFFF